MKINAKLIANPVKSLLFLGDLQQRRARSEVSPEFVLAHEAKPEPIPRGGYAMGLYITSVFYRAICGTARIAVTCVCPFAMFVAALHLIYASQSILRFPLARLMLDCILSLRWAGERVITVVSPAPVGINNDLAFDVAAATRSTLLPGQAWISLGGVGANLLGDGHRRREESGKTKHFFRF